MHQVNEYFKIYAKCDKKETGLFYHTLAQCDLPWHLLSKQHNILVQLRCNIFKLSHSLNLF